MANYSFEKVYVDSSLAHLSPGYGAAFDTLVAPFVYHWYAPGDTSAYGAPSTYSYPYLCHIQNPLVTNPQYLPGASGKTGAFPLPMSYHGTTHPQIRLRKNYTSANIDRSFLCQKLQTPLTTGKTYYVEFYTRPSAFATFLTKNMGLYFSADSIEFYDYYQDLTPHIEATQMLDDTTKWYRVSGTYVADGSERFITLGNVRHDTSSAYILSNFPILPGLFRRLSTDYFVDAISIYLPEDTVYTLSLPNDTLLCPGETLNLVAQLDDGFKLEDTTTTYLWSNGSTDSTLLVSQPGTYWVQSTINQRFNASDTIVVEYFPANYQLNLPDTVKICEGETATILATPDPMQLTAYLWSTGDTLTGIQTNYDGQYWLNAQTPCYPLSDSTWVVQDFCESYLWVPNAFTPDGDGTNDFFEFFGAPEPVSFSVFNRWGQQVFYSENYQNNWDGTFQGKPLPAGAYTYVIEYFYINPNANQANPKGSKRQLRGVVNLIR